MRDSFGRDIDYMRISITDRCNLRCTYCMPEDLPDIPHDEILRYEEILRICDAASHLGIRNFRVTGGEPFVRKGAASFLRELARRPYADSVSVTTNGLLLKENIPALQEAGVSGVNISLDALSGPLYRKITGTDASAAVLTAIHRVTQAGIPVKTNTVLLKENENEWLTIAALAEDLPVRVRFIEYMPSACAQAEAGNPQVLLAELRERYPDLAPVADRSGNGPAEYFGSTCLQGHIGLIAARAHRFCDACNRIRLTSTGQLLTCLGHPGAADLRDALRSGIRDEDLRTLLAKMILAKPRGHCFGDGGRILQAMHAIGG